MTNLQAIKLQLKVNGLSDDDYKLMLEEFKFNPDDTYTPSRGWDWMLVNQIVRVFSGGISSISVSEGGYSKSISYDYTSLNNYLLWLLNKWGWQNPLSSLGGIKNYTDKW